MKINNKGKVLIGAITVIFIVLTVISLTTLASSPLRSAVQLFAIWGLYFILISSIMTAFLKEMYKAFGVPFIKVHHFFAIAGIVFATLHPVAFAIEVSTARVFIPATESWIAFWELAGRPAIYLIYIAVAAGVLRKKLKNSWRKIHALMYVVAVFLIVHANLIGTNFGTLTVSIIMNGLFAFSMGAMIYKQVQKYQRKKAIQEKKSKKK